MTSRFLSRCLCTVAFLVSYPTYAGDISQCYLVAEGRADVVRFDAQMANGTEVTLSAILIGPEGTGPFPAIVMVPGSHGPWVPGCYGSLVEKFVDWGYVAIIPYGTTALDNDGNRMLNYSFADRASYAYGAASAVARLSQVDPVRIGLWGHSNGGLSAIDAASSKGARPGSPFRTAVVAAPVICPASADRPTIPMLLLIGDKDKEVALDSCIDFVKQLADINEFEFLLIPDGGHGWWNPADPGYNETAARLAETRLKAFLAMHLNSAP